MGDESGVRPFPELPESGRTGEREEALALRFRGDMCGIHGCSNVGGEISNDLLESRAGHKVAANRCEVDVIVEKFASCDSVVTFLCEQRLSVEELYTGSRTCGNRPNDFVDTGIGAETKDIQITSTNEVVVRRSIIAEEPLAAGDSELKFGILIVDLCGGKI